ncbi:F-box domain-containing protein [Mycena sanguinolenta]|uniref:F-box domain-containing protein n=1 Tax=Mycena sanguinolenta TaxID=230812 RepID=A0A8H7D1Z5_9AGAR|nr:F-box domain-containing protein [Mycena sanguinolenta]
MRMAPYLYLPNLVLGGWLFARVSTSIVLPMSASLRGRLAELNAQISEQRRVLDKLERIRSDVERELHATATFPVLTLPPEITTEIFLHCLAPLGSPPCIPGALPVPIVLASVCGLWRSIAHASPALWSKLDVRFDSIPTRVASKPGLVEQLTDLWFCRARTRPLAFGFRSEDKYFPLHRLRDIIHRWSHQMRHIYLDLADRWFDIRALGLHSAAFPLLQSATFDGRADVDATPSPTILFGDAFYFNDFGMPFRAFSSSRFTLPWFQLTKFNGVLENLELFNLTPNLTELTCKFEPDEDADFAVIIHCNLTSLIVRPSDCGDILQYLTLPTLRHLDVSSMESHDSLESFLARSSPPLVSLITNMDAYSDMGHLGGSLLLVLRTLETLELPETSAIHIPFIFQFFTSNPSNLRTLIFKDVEGGALPLVTGSLLTHALCPAADIPTCLGRHQSLFGWHDAWK